MSRDASVTDLTRGIYRRLYAGFIKGQRINQISLQAEAWFWRILAIVDDFGNADAEIGLLYGATVGRRRGITLKDVQKWLGELGESRLIQIYADESGDKYLHVVGFEELQPAGKNGKRLKRVPLPGESRLIQNNPDLPEKSQASDNHSDNDNDTERSRSKAALVRSVFDFWKEHLNHPKAVLDQKREAAIAARLKAGYSVDDLLLAIRGCKNTPFNMGENDRHEKFDDIELICRDAKRVDKFISRAEGKSNGSKALTGADVKRMLGEVA